MENNNTNNNIQKPVSVIIEETKGNLAKVINESGLHLSLIEMIFKDMYLEVCNQAERIYVREKAAYEQLCLQKENDSNVDN